MRLSYMALLCVVTALMIIVPVSAVNVGTIINHGATVYIGERGLDISKAMTVTIGNVTTQRQTIAFWQPGSNFDTQPLEIMPVGDGKNFEISTYMRTGSWYSYDTTGNTQPIFAFYVVDPKINVIIRNEGVDVNNKTVTKDSSLKFEINSNLYQLDNRYNDESLTPINPLTNGFIDVKVTSPDGATYINLVGNGGTRQNTENIFVNAIRYTWNGDWDLSAVDTNGQRIYPAGVYSVVAESTLNGMNVNYNAVGKTSSEPVEVTIGFSSVVLTIDKKSVMRNKPFAITITGGQNTYYNLWVKDTSKLTDINEQPPTIAESQEGVSVNDPITGDYTIYNTGGKMIKNNVPSPSVSSGPYYARVLTSLEGSRTVQFNTGPDTKDQKFTIRVEENSSGQYKFDEVTVVVGTGTMTIVTQGYQSYYIGEVIRLSGTNTESYETFLFITGPNLPTNGAQLDSLNPRSDAIINGNRDTFHIEQVDSGDWSWDLQTTGLALDAGSYTIYAVSNASDRLHLAGNSYATTSITLRKPFVTASISQGTVAKGDKLYIRGIAEGSPSNGVQIWIMGKNYMLNDIASTDSGSTFEYEIDRTTTDGLSNGQYFVVVQHPMQNGQFDIILRDNYIVNLQLGNDTEGGTKIFQIEGSGSLQGPDAAEALIKSLDNQNIDDTYTKLQFVIDQPLISLDTIGNRRIGEKFTITGRTNLAVGNNVLIEIYSSTFKPTEKSTSGEFSGAAGTVKVVENDGGNGYNRIEFQVDASTFREDEYIVIAQGTDIDVSGSTLFNIIGQSLVNQTVTPTVIPMSTPIPTPIPTTIIPTPTSTPASPGFGAIFALTGICIIGFVIVRRE